MFHLVHLIQLDTMVHLIHLDTIVHLIHLDMMFHLIHLYAISHLIHLNTIFQVQQRLREDSNSNVQQPRTDQRPGQVPRGGKRNWVRQSSCCKIAMQ